MDRRHDEKLMKKVSREKRGDEMHLDEKIEKEIDSEITKSQEKTKSSQGIWRKRALYLLAAIAVFLLMPYFLDFIAHWTGVTAFTDIYGPLVFWNQLSAPAFLLGFVSICIFTAVIMYFILRSFEVQEGAW
jgi:uncharacterized membrane protein